MTTLCSRADALHTACNSAQTALLLHDGPEVCDAASTL
jgi:hypothetical protein